MRDVVIIGAGPAGLSACLYASRAGLNTLLIEKGLPGGQLNNTDKIDNYLGAPQKEGMELAEEMYAQAMSFGGEQTYGEVTEVQQNSDTSFTVYVGGEQVNTHTVIVATGTEYKTMGIPGETELIGRGVSYCAVCDAPFYKDKKLAVIGGGDSALEEADYLTNFASEVTVIHRRDEYRAKPHLQDRVKKNPKIRQIMNVDTTKIKGEDSVNGIIFYDKSTDSNSSILVDGVFIYIGQNPQSEFLKGLKITNANGYITNTGINCETEIPGLYAVGDIIDKPVRQVANAVGEGAEAGQAAYNYINDNK